MAGNVSRRSHLSNTSHLNLARHRTGFVWAAKQGFSESNPGVANAVFFQLGKQLLALSNCSEINRQQ